MDQPAPSAETQAQRAREFVTAHRTLRSEVQKIIVGHDDVIDHVLIGLFAGGHILIEGVPGLGESGLRLLGLPRRRAPVPEVHGDVHADVPGRIELIPGRQKPRIRPKVIEVPGEKDLGIPSGPGRGDAGFVIDRSVASMGSRCPLNRK